MMYIDIHTYLTHLNLVTVNLAVSYFLTYHNLQMHCTSVNLYLTTVESLIFTRNAHWFHNSAKQRVSVSMKMPILRKNMLCATEWSQSPVSSIHSFIGHVTIMENPILINVCVSYINCGNWLIQMFWVYVLIGNVTMT